MVTTPENPQRCPSCERKTSWRPALLNGAPFEINGRLVVHCQHCGYVLPISKSESEQHMATPDPRRQEPL